MQKWSLSDDEAAAANCYLHPRTEEHDCIWLSEVESAMVTNIPLSPGSYFGEPGIPANMGNTHWRNHAPKQIVLHHTAGGGDAHSVHAWFSQLALGGRKIATHFVINRSGEIVQLIPLQYWAIHLGAAYNIECDAIGIELCSWGRLKNNRTTYTGNSLDPQLAEEGGDGFYEKYTDQQIEASEKLCRGLCNLFSIDTTISEAFAAGEYHKLSPQALGGTPGVWSHRNFRPDKSDINWSNLGERLIKSCNRRIQVVDQV
jgi:hypothetical protein